MRQPYPHHEHDPGLVRLWNDRASLEVTRPLDGALRLRHAPDAARTSALHPRLAPKRSWAIIHERAEPLETSEGDGRLTVTGGGVSLELELATGGWAFRDASGREVARALAADALDDRGGARSRLILAAPDGEAYLGFGERVGPLDKRGMRLTFWNTDVVPHQPDTDPMYQSIPLFVGLRDGIAWGFLLDEPWRSEVDVARAERSRLEWTSWGPELDAHLIAGPRVEDVLARYTALTGRAPLPPLWSLGAQQSRWGYETADEIRAVIEGYRSRDLPLDAVYLDIDHMDAYKVWTFNRARFPDPAGLARDAAERGVRLVTIVDPGIKLEPGYRVYDEALANDYLVRLDRGDVLVGEVWPKPAVFPDLTRAEVQNWWGGLHRAFLEAGIAGFWNDMNEPSCFALQDDAGGFSTAGETVAGVGTIEGKTLPYDARHGTRRHLEVHNVYALGMAQASFDGQRELAPDRRPFVLTRAGFAGIQRYAAVWTGDNSSYWEHLELSIPMLIGLGLSGVAFTGADIPGFTGAASGELLARWTQAGVFYPLMRNHAALGTPPQEPWRFGEPHLTHCRQALERRYRLLPTLYTLLHEASRNGLPVLRPLALLAPRDPAALRADDQLLFGPDLLVAPVVRPGRTRRLAYLPAGAWLEFSNLEPGEAILEGGRHAIADAPAHVTPAWLRAGGAIALTAPAMHTTSANWTSLQWHVHAAASIEGRLYEDAGDGYGPHRETTLTGSLAGGTLGLERRATGELTLERTRETLRVHGLPGPARSVDGAASHDQDGTTLALTLDADWERVVVRL